MSPDPVTWRLFIALELPDAVRAALGRLIERLRRDWPADVRWVAAENIHLTLRFLGNSTPDRVPALAERLAEVVPAHLPIDLALAELGAFPGWGQPRVIWIGLAGDQKRLDRLQQSVAAAVEAAGWPAAEKPFRPHLTIGRVRDRGSRGAVGRSPSRPGRPDLAPEQPAWRAEQVALFRSELAPSGPTYYRVAAWRPDFLAKA